MFRTGTGALDQQISQTIAAIEHRQRLVEADESLGREEARLRALLGACRASMIEAEHEAKPGLSLGRLWSALRKHAERDLLASLQSSDLIIVETTIQAELNAIEVQRQKLKTQRTELAGADAHLKELFDQKEAWLADTDSPNAADIMAIADKRGQWLALASCLEMVVDAAYDAQSELAMTTTFLDGAGRVFNESENSSTEGRAQQAKVHASIASLHCRRLRTEVQAATAWCKHLKLEDQGGVFTPMGTSAPDFSEQLVRVELVANLDGVDASGAIEVELRAETDWVSKVAAAGTVLGHKVQEELAKLDGQREKLLSP